jgi:hypothetical protein
MRIAKSGTGAAESAVHLQRLFGLTPAEARLGTAFVRTRNTQQPGED